VKRSAADDEDLTNKERENSLAQDHRLAVAKNSWAKTKNKWQTLIRV
jgi:hypothetical protein